MKRRVVSLLAIVAMLCTMVVFAMPAVAGDAETYPCYSQHAAKEAEGYDGKNWSISTAADWKAMIETANAAAAGSVYFDGVTFHLTNDVDFSQTEWLAPMGAGSYFGGTINGHGYGFDDFKIYEGGRFDDSYAVADEECATGMFHRLGNCTFIDFGVNSGASHRAATGGTSAATTFGGLVNGYKPTFTRVWSGMVMRHTSSGTVSALATPAEGHYTENIAVNGFVYDGKILSTYNKNGFSIVGNYSGNRYLKGAYTFTNILTDAQMYTNTKKPQVPQLNGEDSLAAGAVSAPSEVVATAYTCAMFASYNTTTDKNSIYENVYGVTYPNAIAFLGRTEGERVPIVDAKKEASSLEEAAWKTNKNPSQNAEPVYFTLKNGKVRPVAEDTNMIVKVTLTGIFEKEYYLNANTEYDLEDVFGKNGMQSYAIKAGSLSSISGDKLALGKEDVTIEVTTDCLHANSTYTATENAHIQICNSGCGFHNEVACSALTYTVNDITDKQLAAGEKATHSGTCQFCGQDFVLDCTAEYVISEQADSYWDFSDCACGRENIVHKDTAPVVAGDVSGDNTVDLIDAIRVLKKIASMDIEISQRNADVSGDFIVDMRDVSLLLRAWMGDTKVITAIEEVQQRANVANFYDSSKVTAQSLKMDGTKLENPDHFVTDAIEVSEGNKVTFGPVRMGQPVMAYFYDADGNPLQLVNHANVQVEYTFEAGKVMVSAIAPEKAATVKMQLTENEKEQFYVRINNNFSIGDYEKNAKADADAIVNPLKGMTALTVGDSLCAAANDYYNAGLKGWAARIRDSFDAIVTNSSQGGATISTARWVENPDKPRQYILNQLLEHTVGNDFDYILLEGGANDAAAFSNEGAPLGTFDPNSYDPADFDAETTVAGGMERLIYSAVRDHGDTAAIGYMTIYKTPDSAKYTDTNLYFEMIEKVCEKWGIAYLDFYNDLDFDTTTLTSDNLHATSEGYDLMQPHINEHLLEMRPISYDIYKEVMATIEIPEAKEDGGALYSAEENPYKDSLKILAIGNSFSQDATQYLWGIADSYGVENVVIGNMKIGGCSLDTTYEHITNNAAEYQYQKWATANGGVYAATADTSIATALADEDWDIITLQQASDQNLVYENGREVDTYTKVDEIIAYLQANEPDAKILWHMTWAYPKESTKDAFAAYGNNQLTMYNSLLNRAKELTGKHSALEGVLPVGTAIQNLRDSLLPLGITEISETGAGINRDGFHLNEGIGRYTAALTWYCYLTGADPRDVKYIPDNDFYTSIALYRDQITQSVVNAIQNPYNK